MLEESLLFLRFPPVVVSAGSGRAASEADPRDAVRAARVSSLHRRGERRLARLAKASGGGRRPRRAQHQQPAALLRCPCEGSSVATQPSGPEPGAAQRQARAPAAQEGRRTAQGGERHRQPSSKLRLDDQKGAQPGQGLSSCYPCSEQATLGSASRKLSAREQGKASIPFPFIPCFYN